MYYGGRPRAPKQETKVIEGMDGESDSDRDAIFAAFWKATE
jgi:hypothetical protein